MSLSIEERRRKPAEEFGEPRFFGFSLGGGRNLMDGTHAPEKFEIRKQVLPRVAFFLRELSRTTELI
jgi:hypothetical protein